MSLRRGRIASRRRARTIPRAAAAASRTSPTRRSSSRSSGRSRTRCVGSAASRSRRSRRSSRASRSSTTATSSSTRSRARDVGACARLPQGRPLGRGARDRALLAHRPTSATRSATRCATGRARSGSRRTPRPTAPATCATSSCARDATPGRRSSMLVTAPGEKFERDRFVEVLRGFPEVRSIHWAVNDTPAEVTNVPSTAALGRGRDRGGAARPALPRAAERVPPDEHGDGRAALRARASTSPA